ncbi:hypothetical protein M0805_001117 [Coniferiporia weirii]|nr:hypothetical protein M0805_001117 [Coniferiporia weirii]
MRLHHGLLGGRRALFSHEHLHLRNGRRTFFGLPNLPNLPFLPTDNGSGGGGDGEQTYHERKILPYTQKQLYELIADVDNYYHFVPYCTESKVLSTRPAGATEQAVERKEARLKVGFLAFTESYVSEVTCRPYSSVEAVASSGTPLFKKLVTTWRFQPAQPSSPHPTLSGVGVGASHPSAGSPAPNDGSAGPTLVSIDLTYAFSNPLYAAASAAFFRQVSAMTVQAFEERCLQVYGRGRS